MTTSNLTLYAMWLCRQRWHLAGCILETQVQIESTTIKARPPIRLLQGGKP